MRARPRALREHVRSQLIGGYKIGDEGVAAQRIDVVKNGVLKTLLTSRIPSANNQTSNGHARRTADGGAFHGSAANLFVTGAARCRAGRSINGWSRPPPARGGLKSGVVIRRSTTPRSPRRRSSRAASWSG